MAESKRLAERIANSVVKILLHVVCKLDVSDLRKIPRIGAGILMSNHTTNIEGPALYVFVQPRQVTGLAKTELWENWLTRFFMNAWDIIPVRRGKLDFGALRASINALRRGSLLGVAPEGTRSKSGNLKRAERGVAMLAEKTGATVYPTAQWGFRDLGKNLKRLRRTPVTIRVGPPFTVGLPKGVSSSPAVLRQVADEMMYQIAKLLPEEYRGVYSDFSRMTVEYIRFLTPETSQTAQ